MSDRDDTILAAVAGRPTSSTGWMRANCPICEVKLGKPDRKQCFGLHVSGSWHCFRCGSSGRLHHVPDDWDFVISPEVKAEVVATVEPPDGFVHLYEGDGAWSVSCDIPRNYLREKRNVTDELGERMQMGACFGGKFGERVVIPVLDAEEKRWVGFVARAWNAWAERKVLYPKGMRRADILYNHAALYRKDDGPVLVTEGCFDALAVYPFGVACLGKPSAPHIEALIACGRSVAVCLDGDAHRQAEALAARLRMEGVDAGSVRLPPEKDPATVDREQLLKAAAMAVEQGRHVALEDA